MRERRRLVREKAVLPRGECLFRRRKDWKNGDGVFVTTDTKSLVRVLSVQKKRAILSTFP